MNNWYVITGGPSSGKTTTITLLAQKGFKTIEETARKYFESQAKKGLTLQDIRGDHQRWQDAISNLQAELEQSLDRNETYFMDRALPDGLAYYEFLNLRIPSSFAKSYRKSSYKKVFLLERLPQVADDGVRIETSEEADWIAEGIKRSYSAISSEIIHIPFMDPEERVDLILKNIK